MTGTLVDADTGEVVPIVYRLFNATGALLYVGCTTRGATRILEHRSKPWWRDVAECTVTSFTSLAEALAAEASAIRLEAPVHNIQHQVDELSPEATLATLLAARERARRELEAAQAELDAYDDTMDLLRPLMEPNPRMTVAGALALIAGDAA